MGGGLNLPEKTEKNNPSRADFLPNMLAKSWQKYQILFIKKYELSSLEGPNKNEGPNCPPFLHAHVEVWHFYGGVYL